MRHPLPFYWGRAPRRRGQIGEIDLPTPPGRYEAVCSYLSLRYRKGRGMDQLPEQMIHPATRSLVMRSSVIYELDMCDMTTQCLSHLSMTMPRRDPKMARQAERGPLHLRNVAKVGGNREAISDGADMRHDYRTEMKQTKSASSNRSA